MIARGWATVELERAARELGDRLRPGAAFVEAADSELLAARCLVGELVDGPDGRWLVLLEPSTEGRISATLARHGEGWVASWEARGVPTATTGSAGSDRSTWSVERPGPLGPERLRLADSVFGPHRLVLTTATIDP